MEVHHAVFHRRLIRPLLVAAFLPKQFAAVVHALADFFVLQRGFIVGLLFGSDKFRLEQCDFFRVIKFYDVAATLGPARYDGGNHQNMRIPLDHDVRVIGEPDRALRWFTAFAKFEHHLVPLLVRFGARPRQRFIHAHRLHAVPVAEFPVEFVAIDKFAQARMKRLDVVILEINLDERFPVEVVFGDFDFIEYVTGKIEILHAAQAREIGGDIARPLKQHAVPFLQLLFG